MDLQEPDINSEFCESILTEFSTCNSEIDDDQNFKSICANSIISTDSENAHDDVTFFQENKKKIFGVTENLAEYLDENVKPFSRYQTYCADCHKYDIAPIQDMEDVLENGKTILDLQWYPANNLDIKQIVVNLTYPDIVNLNELNLSNCIHEGDSVDICTVLSNFITNSVSLKTFDLEYCHIGPDGAEILSNGISFSKSLQFLNLKHCHLNDTGGEFIINALTTNKNVTNVDISHNNLDTKSGLALGKFFTENNAVKDINLEWNQLCSIASINSMMKGMTNNNSIKRLNLSWNGLKGEQFVKPFVRMVKKNTVVENIHLRLLQLQEETEFKLLASAIKSSTSLKHLSLEGSVDWNTNYVDYLLKACTKPGISLQILSFGSYYITMDMYKIVERVELINPTLKIEYQDVLMKNEPETVNFREILIDRCKYLAMKPKKAKLKRDMGHFMYQLKDSEQEFLTPEEFEEQLKKFKIKLDLDLINQLVEEFDGLDANKGMLAAHKMADYYLARHITEKPPPPPPPKAAKKSKKNKKK